MNAYYNTHACKLMKLILSTDFSINVCRITEEGKNLHQFIGGNIYLMFDGFGSFNRSLDSDYICGPLLNLSRTPMYPKMGTGEDRVVNFYECYIIPGLIEKGSEKEAELYRLMDAVDSSVLYHPNSPEASLVTTTLKALSL